MGMCGFFVFESVERLVGGRWWFFYEWDILVKKK
jgi:hypothetical protein